MCVCAPVFGGTKGSLKVFLGLKYLIFLKQIWVVFQEEEVVEEETQTLHTQFLQETFDLISQEKVQSNFI